MLTFVLVLVLGLSLLGGSLYGLAYISSRVNGTTVLAELLKLFKRE